LGKGSGNARLELHQWPKVRTTKWAEPYVDLGKEVSTAIV